MIQQMENGHQTLAFSAWIFCSWPDGDESPDYEIEGDTFEEVERTAKCWKGAKVIVMFDSEKELCQYSRTGRCRRYQWTEHSAYKLWITKKTVTNC